MCMNGPRVRALCHSSNTWTFNIYVTPECEIVFSDWSARVVDFYLVYLNMWGLLCRVLHSVQLFLWNLCKPLVRTWQLKTGHIFQKGLFEFTSPLKYLCPSIVPFVSLHLAFLFLPWKLFFSIITIYPMVNSHSAIWQKLQFFTFHPRCLGVRSTCFLYHFLRYPLVRYLVDWVM